MINVHKVITHSVIFSRGATRNATYVYICNYIYACLHAILNCVNENNFDLASVSTNRFVHVVFSFCSMA